MPETKLASLIYFSHRHPSPPPSELEDILTTSVRNNRDLNITGLLVSDERFFMQVIEGAPLPLNELYKQITTDKRHHHVTLIDYSMTNDRSFEHWWMAAAKVPEFIERYLKSRFGGFEPAKFSARDAREYLEMLRDQLLEEE